MESGVVHIKTTGSTPDYLHPWRTGDRWSSYGSGFVIKHEKELLVVTNAHVVENGKRFAMNTIGTGKDVPLSLIQYLPEIDIAFLKPSEKLPEQVQPFELADKMPPKGAQLRILGFPLGGQNISSHIGTFNRIIWVTYMDVATGLCMQTDTTMNPGVSGGPALDVQNKVVGVCVSGLRNYQNFNHLIPSALVLWGLSVLRKPVAIGGFPFRYTATKNSMLRELLSLPDDLGILITESSDKNLKTGDVITHIDNHPIQQNSTIDVSAILAGDNNEVAFIRYYPSIRSVGAAITLNIIRNKKPLTINSKIIANYRPANILPPIRTYYALAGWVFAPWNRYTSGQHEKAGHEIAQLNINDVYIVEEWDTEFTEQVDARFSKILDVNGKEISDFAHFVSVVETIYKKASGIISIGYRNVHAEIGRIMLDMSIVVEAQSQIMADHASGAERYLLPKSGGYAVTPPALLDPDLS